MKTEMVKCKSGVWGSQGKLRDNYDSFEEFKHYSHIHNLHARLGYKSSKAAWKANPTIQWSVIPTDFSKVKVQKPLVPTVVLDYSKPPSNCPHCNGEREWVRFHSLSIAMAASNLPVQQRGAKSHANGLD